MMSRSFLEVPSGVGAFVTGLSQTAPSSLCDTIEQDLVGFVNQSNSLCMYVQNKTLENILFCVDV